MMNVRTCYAHLKPLACLLSTTLLVTACATPSANTTGDNYYGVPAMYRTIPERISDEAIERTSYKNLPNINGVGDNNVRIAIDSFRREVLLTGEVPSQQVKTDVANMVASIHDVKKVYDNLTVTITPRSQSHTLHENYLKSKIIAKIVSAGGIKSSQYKLVVRDNMAYLLGFLTPKQEQSVVDAIEAVKGMEGVKILSTRVDGNLALLAATGNTVAIDDNPNAGGMIYGGYGATNVAVSNPVNSTPVYPDASAPTTSYPHSMYPNSSSLPATNVAQTGGYIPTSSVNPNFPVVKMEGNPTSPYVNLYNNTSKP